MPSLDDYRTVAPALEKYAQGVLPGELWKRPALTPRDRSIITLAALIARSQAVELAHYVYVALDNGLKPRDGQRPHTGRSVGSSHTQLAFYAGWPNVFPALPVAKEVFERQPDRGVSVKP